MFNYFLAQVNTVVSSGDAAASTTTTATTSGGGMSMSWIFIYIIVIFAAMYFMSIRPQKETERNGANEK